MRVAGDASGDQAIVRRAAEVGEEPMVFLDAQAARDYLCSLVFGDHTVLRALRGMLADAGTLAVWRLSDQEVMARVAEQLVRGGFSLLRNERG